MKRERRAEIRAEHIDAPALQNHSPGVGQRLRNATFARLQPEEMEALELVECARPESYRDFDQIPMRGADLLCQVKLAAPYLARRDVVFVGDHDGTSLLLGLLGARGLLTPPTRMTVLDFDDRLLEVGRQFAAEHMFEIEARLYNVFNRLPADLHERFDCFYTNPPYGASNQGASARLFITRGVELVRDSGEAHILLPNDPKRTWTVDAMYATYAFLLQHGWTVTNAVQDLHRYHLDDDRKLMSSWIVANRLPARTLPMPWAGRVVSGKEIPHFYGKSVIPPYPEYIDTDGREMSAISPVSWGDEHG